MPGRPSTAIRNQDSAELEIGPSPPASSRSSGPANSSPRPARDDAEHQGEHGGVAPSLTARSRCPAPNQRAARLVVPYSREPPIMGSSDISVPAMPSAASGTLPRWPTTAVSTRTNNGSAASTMNAEPDSRSIREVVSAPGAGSVTGRRAGQLVTSAEVNRAQATAPKMIT